MSAPARRRKWPCARARRSSARSTTPMSCRSASGTPTGGSPRPNDAYLALTGFSRAELAAGALRWDELTAPEHRDRDERALAEAAERGAWAPHEKDYLRRDGWRVTVLCGGTILPGHVNRGVAFAIDLTERKRAEALLRELSARLFQTQDEERRRIARELHDVTAQDLFAQSLLLARLDAAADPDAARADLAEARALGARALGQVRTQSYLLHPPLLEELGLATALEWLVNGFARRSGIAVELAADAAVGRLPAAVELALYRVAQEGLGEVHRHAGSATARVALARDGDTAILRVEDRGRGLAGAPEGVGIAGMRERLVPLGGHLALASTPRARRSPRPSRSRRRGTMAGQRPARGHELAKKLGDGEGLWQTKEPHLFGLIDVSAPPLAPRERHYLCGHAGCERTEEGATWPPPRRRSPGCGRRRPSPPASARRGETAARCPVRGSPSAAVGACEYRDGIASGCTAAATTTQSVRRPRLS